MQLAKRLKLSFRHRNGETDVETPNIGFYLSTNDIISASDTYLGEISSSLGRDAPLETVTSVTIPGGTAPGNYFLGAYIDHDNLISETTVANNAAYYAVSVISQVPAVTTDLASTITTAEATLNATVYPHPGGGLVVKLQGVPGVVPSTFIPSTRQ